MAAAARLRFCLFFGILRAWIRLPGLDGISSLWVAVGGARPTAPARGSPIRRIALPGVGSGNARARLAAGKEENGHPMPQREAHGTITPMTSSLSIEGWRLRRRQPAARRRALRVAVTGRALIARDVIRRLSAAGIAEVFLPEASPGGTIADVLVICDSDPSLVRDAALWAVRTCPDTAVVIAAREGLALCREAARASGLTPHLIVAPGGMPRAAVERRRIALALRAAASQAEVPIIGGDGFAGTRPLWRYATVAGIPIDELVGAHDPSTADPQSGEVSDTLLAASAAALARAILLDRRLVLCCTGWADGPFGIPGGYVTAPFRVGARGVEEPLPVRLTVEERALLIRASV